MVLKTYLITILLVFSVGSLAQKKPKLVKEVDDEITKIMDRSVAACDNFYGHVCTNWEQVHQIRESVGRSSIEEMMTDKNIENLRTLLKENFDEDEEDEEPTARQMAKIFYYSCQNAPTDLPSLTNLLNISGGWPTGEDWTSPSGGWIKFAGSVSKTFRSDFLFNTNVYTCTGSGQKVVAFHKPKIVNVNNWDAYTAKVQKTLEKLELPLEEKTVTEIVQFHKNLLGLIAETQNEPYQSRLTKFSEAYDDFGIDFKGYVSESYHKAFDNFNSMSIHDEQYFHKLAELLEDTDIKTKVYYTLWNAIELFLPVLGGDFEEIFNEYNTAILGSTIPKEQICMDLLLRTMNIAAGAIYMDKYWSEARKKAAINMHTDIKRVTIDYLNDNKLCINSDTTHNVRFLGNQLDFRFEEFWKDDAKLNSLYKGAKVTRDNFITSYASLLKVGRERESDYFSQNNLTILELWDQPLVQAKAINIRRENKIVILPGAVQSPLYGKGYPNYLLYSGIGVIIAEAMFNLILTQNREVFGEIGKCYEDQYKGYTIADKPLEPRPEAITEYMTDTLTLKFTYLAYKKKLAKSNPLLEKIEALPELTSEQVFLIASAMMYCEPLKKEARDYILSNDPHPRGEYRINGMVENSKEISNEFNCGRQPKCTIW